MTARDTCIHTISLSGEANGNPGKVSTSTYTVAQSGMNRMQETDHPAVLMKTPAFDTAYMARFVVSNVA